MTAFLPPARGEKEIDVSACDSRGPVGGHLQGLAGSEEDRTARSGGTDKGANEGGWRLQGEREITSLPSQMGRSASLRHGDMARALL